MNKSICASVKIRVPFHDVDPMKIVWHGHYVKYIEIARCELLKKIEYDYPEMAKSGYVWPIVDLQLKYIKPGQYDQVLDVSATLVEYENRLKIEYVIRDHNGTVCTKAKTTQVAVNVESNEMEFASPEILITNVNRVLKNEAE